ncbi:MAG: hypothetical protein IKH38_02030 [Clostridia bacterium]|nr:hypothetical protein [Clostridia bacterium]
MKRARKRGGRKHPLLRAVWQQAKLFLVVLTAYLVQVCIMPYVRIGSVTPSIIFPVLAIITVGLGRMRAVWAGTAFGILLEFMQPSHVLFNLLIYPVAAIFGMLIFADKTVQQLEYERGIGKPGRNASPWLRTLLCTAADTLVYETVNIVYFFVRGGELSLQTFGRGFLDVFLSVLLAALIMVPLRRFFGIRAAVDPGAVLRPTAYRRG